LQSLQSYISIDCLVHNRKLKALLHFLDALINDEPIILGELVNQLQDVDSVGLVVLRETDAFLGNQIDLLLLKLSQGGASSSSCCIVLVDIAKENVFLNL